MIGFNLILPSTNVYKIRCEETERKDIVNKLCSQWEDYCLSHWISDNHEDPFCPENKVKRFLDGLGYFLLRSNTSGIITDYKDEMNQNREIPVSCCPDFVHDLFYAAGQGDISQAQKEALQSLNGYLDEKVKRKPIRKKSTPYEKKRQRKESFEAQFSPISYQYPPVDTNGDFTVESFGKQITCHISENCKQYAPKFLKDDVIYDMDHVVVANVKESESSYRFYFFDQDFIPIDMFVNSKND